ncbi:tRNA (adenine(58)-N(1))-methyltransferase catalytic subunit TRMT61A [Aphis craccivora]|uniref:tRNA (adenine(58)-N(1))-methyltransferase n=1 Tax=Aphis craccivora TaxID=307492 RepID=A0A6G0ZE21_APHCR|nr:tRNA (adenine(58)-N(1))-methyltransferase catalytic subunit TRMT61A [Aphis craccivora]
MRTCQTLQEHGFIQIKTVECLEKEYQVVNRTVTTFATASRPSSSSVPQRIFCSRYSVQTCGTLNIYIAYIYFYLSVITYISNTTEEHSNDKKFVACIPSASPRGHTGYLTTATYLMETPLQLQEAEIEDVCEK